MGSTVFICFIINCLTIQDSSFRGSSGAWPVHGRCSQLGWTNHSGKEREVDNKSLKCTESKVDDWSCCRDTLFILYSSWWSTKTPKSLKTVPETLCLLVSALLEKNKTKKPNKQRKQQSLQSSQCAWWWEPTDCGSKRMFLLFANYFGPRYFLAGSGLFLILEHPHMFKRK